MDREKNSGLFTGCRGVDVGDRLARIVKGEGVALHVYLSVGEYDISKVKSEELHRRFRKALGRICEHGGVPLIYGILFRKGVSREGLSRETAMNGRLADHCKSYKWSFDNRDSFYGINTMYARNGVHLFLGGSAALADRLERRVGK